MTTQLARNDGTAALAAGLFGTNLFGPLSVWSSLLGKREHLQLEIDHGRKCLERLRRSLAECGTLLQARPADGHERGNGRLPSSAQAAPVEDIMEQSLLNWLERLEERLDAVVKEIEQHATHGWVEPLNPDESVFELLRAAG